MKLLKKTLSILLVSLGVYLMTELLNDKKFFDFSEEETIPRLIISLIVGIINELMVKYRKSP